MSREYYNGAYFGQSESSLGERRSRLDATGYPGRTSRSTTPVDYGSQVGTFSGNNTGIALGTSMTATTRATTS